MPSSPSPSSSVQAARQALADHLKEIREGSGLKAVDLAGALGCHKSKISRIENAVQPVTQADIQMWCTACNADERAPDLIAALRNIDSAYVEWRRLETTGLRRLQESSIPLYERTRWMRVYQAQVVPGLLQRPMYVRALLSSITRFRQLPDDVVQAVDARLARRKFLTEGRHTFAFLLEECVLKHRIGDTDTMRDQLAHLLEMMAMPSVSIGVIPETADRPMWPIESFTIYDDSEARLELLTARVAVTAPGEIGLYERAFDELSEFCVFGESAQALIRAAHRDH
ncbi:helix-turn-helix domain-containing protein [Actinomadura harenae]|uniref:XRE family transcriptional regulator n=1 Tax=Actinomadura harenae TaxID=2483351 RepID=A0A3M2LWS7_9ACTN|nr:helix-turn-helix transcriptional regulator [Actinomadura harenae]RMI41013.1 XRE family transcriptional regulator [Actinomadura harenae]